MDPRLEVRLRCIEAAARHPVPHKDGFVAGILAAAIAWEDWVFQPPVPAPRQTITLPKKA